MNKINQLLDSIKNNESISVFGINENHVHLAIKDLDSFIYVLKDLPASLKAKDSLSYIQDIVFLPIKYENDLNVRQSLINRLQRTNAIYKIALNKTKKVICSVDSLTELFPKKEYIVDNTISLSVNTNIDLTDLIKRLLFLGYKRVNQINELGEFAVRGDILDISPINLTQGVRIDLFDESIERIRLFEIDSQLAGEEINQIDIAPFDETFYLGEIKLDELMQTTIIYVDSKSCFDNNNQIKSNFSNMVTFDRFLVQNRIFNPKKIINFDEDDTNYFKQQEKQLKKQDNTNLAKADSKQVFFVPKVNEYVVHPTHGIGLCQGIKRMKMGQSERDYIVISYLNGDSLYVSAENTNLISAYLGEEKPKLSKIGGVEFKKLKDKAKKAIKEMAFDLSKVYAKRESLRGHKYSDDNSALQEFDDDFIYKETPCQLIAERECISDLTSGKIMDRLLCGDVGYGKTEVAMRVMMKVVLENKQCAFISPTTVLADQHYKTLTKRMEKFGVKIASLTRFNSTEQIKKVLEDLKNQRIDIVCGTHRVLSKDVIFKDLGLLVLDEEQRFGVADKEKIKLIKGDVNVLSLSATPIPRTLHMSMSGIRDISVLDTAPLGRIPVFTSVTEYSVDLLVEAVNREIERKGQVFIVYNRVETMDSYAFSLTQLFPHLNIKIAHGQMSKNLLEDTINKFILGEIDILVTSTIIENGIDMQNVNTMIVVNADRFGLSQLYQLRGRVGRGKKLAYAYFTFDESKSLTENAYKRLDAITSYTEFGSGFKLAMRDLEIRGAGNILGSEQHGHMQRVGYDMYLRLIKEVMDEMNGQSQASLEEIKVITDFSAYIPDDYIVDSSFRLKAYKQIALINSLNEGQNQLNQLKNIYGNVPREVNNLIYIALIKNLAQGINAIKVTLTKEKGEIKFINNDSIDIDIIKKAVGEGFNYSAADSALTFKIKPDSNKKLMNFLLSVQKND